jgi:hypothetical protein
MLSPGECWKEVPKDRLGNLSWRAYLLQRAAANKRLRERYQEACSQDILFYLNSFAWTYNPKGDKGDENDRRVQRVVPFITYSFQDRALQTIVGHIDKQRDLVIEKSREVGASWLCIYAMEWLWHFHDWTESLMISRMWDLVDGKTPHALFWKIDFHHQWLPEWLTPRMNRNKGFFENLDNGSTMTGQATTEKAGVGGRATVIFFDEFSRVDDGIAIRDGTADVADCRIFNSTHTGPGTAFHGLCTNGVTDKLVMHWTEHPIKSRGAYRYDPEVSRVVPLDRDYEYPNDFSFVLDGSPAGGPYPGIRSPWYDYECARRGSSRAIAMDLDIDVSGSQAQFFDPMLIRRLVGECCEPYWRGSIEYELDTAKPKGLKADPGGNLKLWLNQLPTGGLPPLSLVIGGDIAWGSGATRSCLCGIDVHKGEKVLEYASAQVDPKELAHIVVALAWLFKDADEQPAELIWEQQGPGVTFGGEVLALGFRNVFYRTAEMPHSMEMKVSLRPGWVPNKETKTELLAEYRSALSLRQLINRSAPALQECLAFKFSPDGHATHAHSENKDNPGESRVNHSDLVIADALAWKLAKGKGIKSGPQHVQEIHPGSLAYRRQLAHDRASNAEEW